MISHRYRCVFVHVPKVAGQSVEEVFLRLHDLTWKTRAPLLLRANNHPEQGPPRLAHLKALEYVRFGHVTQEQFDSYLKFSFVRNPWDRMVSFFKYLGAPQKHGFKEFLMNEFKNYIWTRHHWFVGPQSEFVCDAQGKALVDFIGRFESLQDDFNHVCQQLGLSFLELPHRNKSKNRRLKNALRPKLFLSQDQRVPVFRHYQDYYDDESKEFVAELYRKDIEFFKYRFGYRSGEGTLTSC